MARYQDDSMDQPRGMMRRAPAPQQTAPMATRRTAGGVDAGEMGRPWNQTFSGGGAQPMTARPAMPPQPMPGAPMGGVPMQTGMPSQPMPQAAPGVAAPLPVYTGTPARYNPNMAG